MTVSARPASLARGAYLFCALVLTLGCDERLAGPSALTDTVWELTSIEQPLGITTPIADPARFTLRLGSDGTVAIRSDCNTCGGRYTQSGNNISMPTLACTRAFCGTNLDEMYTTALAQAQTTASTRDELVLRGPTATLRFRRRAV